MGDLLDRNNGINFERIEKIVLVNERMKLEKWKIKKQFGQRNEILSWIDKYYTCLDLGHIWNILQPLKHFNHG